MNDLFFGLAATGIGSLPHQRTEKALQLIRRHLREVPFWPQLPRRCPAELMDRQFLQPLPGLQLVDGSVTVDASCLQKRAETILRRYIDKEPMPNPSLQYAAGLHAFADGDWSHAQVVKGQITGPITLGLAVKDRSNNRPALYSDQIMQYIVALLTVSAAWQEQFLRNACEKPTIMFVDEPAFASLGSAFYPYPAEKTRRWLGEIIGAMSGLTAVHCCGSADWPMLMQLGFDIISFDAYQYGEQFVAHAEAVADFCRAGGMLAWGLVPTDPTDSEPRLQALVEKWEALSSRILEGGGDMTLRQLASRSLITPACGLGAGTVSQAKRALALTEQLSGRLRRTVYASD